jgi:hypothetical protein
MSSYGGLSVVEFLELAQTANFPAAALDGLENFINYSFISIIFFHHLA